jgi:hypothetical protein
MYIPAPKAKTPSKPFIFKGLDTTTPEELVDHTAIVDGKNMICLETDSIENRGGQRVFGNYLGSGEGQAFSYRDKDGLVNNLLVHGTKLYYLTGGNWVEVSGITLTANLKMSGVYSPFSNSFYLSNGTDNVVKYSGAGSASSMAGMKKGTGIAFFDNRLVAWGVAGQPDLLWVYDIASETVGADSYIRTEGKILNLVEYAYRSAILITTVKIYRVPGLTSTPVAAGAEGLFIIPSDNGACGSRASALVGGSIMFAGLSNDSGIELYYTNGQVCTAFGSMKIKETLLDINVAYAENIVMVNDSGILRMAYTPVGGVLNTKEILYDYGTFKYSPVQEYAFGISSYAEARVNNGKKLIVADQTYGITRELEYSHADLLVAAVQSTNNTDTNISGSSTTRVSQSFTLPTSVAAFQSKKIVGGAILIKKNTGTTAELKVRIETTAAGLPSGTLAHSAYEAVIAAFSETTYAYKTFSFSNQDALAGSTDYHLVVKHTVEGSGSSQYQLGTNNAGGYSGGSMQTYAAGSWTDVPGSDLAFVLFYEEDIESYVTQTSNLGNDVNPKRIMRHAVQGSSELGCNAFIGISNEGKRGTFHEKPLDFTGKSNKWATSNTDTDNLIWADSENDTQSNRKWSSTSYSYSKMVRSYQFLRGVYISTRFYYKGQSDFRVVKYTPTFVTVPTVNL